jgi:hypothetical protein
MAKQKKAENITPTHASFIKSLDSKSELRDFDLVSTPNWLFIITAEADSSIGAHAIHNQDGKHVISSKIFKLDGGLNVCSCSLARPKTDTDHGVYDTYRFVVAVSTFDHC